MRLNLPRAASALAVFVLSAGPASAALLTLANDPLFTVSPGQAGYPFLDTANNQRGLAYNPTTGNVVVVSRTTGNTGVFVLNGQTGALVGQLNTTGIAGGTFVQSSVGVGDDGAIYVANLTTGSAGTTASGPFRLYRYASEAAGLTSGLNVAPAQVYTGNPTNDAAISQRFGDSFDVRGAGASTQVLLGGRNSTATVHVSAILSPTDATASSFVSQAVDTSYGANLGVAFGDGSQYYSKNSGTPNLNQVTVTGGTGTVSATGAVLSQAAPIDYDPVNKLLALIGYSTQAAPINMVVQPIVGTTTFNLYDLTDPTAPVLVASRNIASNNPNNNGVGAVEFGENGVLYALATNNGVVAYNLVPVPEPATAGLVALAAVAALGRRVRRIS